MKIQVGDVISIRGTPGQWLCEKAGMAGGGTGHGSNDIYPDGWQLQLRKLTNGQPSGDPLTRYQTGCFTRSAMLLPDDFEPLFKMVPRWQRV